MTDSSMHTGYEIRKSAVGLVARYDWAETNGKYVKMRKGRPLRPASRTASVVEKKR